MLTLGAITFLTPLALLGAALLPLVWLLLRLIPPAVRRLDFPAARLLFDLPPTERTSARTPPWLVALRLALLMLALIGLADPILTAHRTGSTGSLVIVMDDGWAAANEWTARQRTLRNLLEQAERHGRDAALITTAPTAVSGTAPKVTPAREALARAGALQPQPWAVDRAQAAAALGELVVGDTAEAVWISDGVATAGDDRLVNALGRFRQVTVITANDVETPLVVLPPRRSDSDPSHIEVPVHRVAPADVSAGVFAIRALDKNGHVLARSNVAMDQGILTSRAVVEAPPELSNRIVRFDAEGHPGAAATALADSRWQRRPVGVASANVTGITAPLLEESFYVRQALGTSADVREGSLDELLSRPLAVLFMGGGRVLDAELEKVTRWVEGGGVLVRFAGPRLVENVDPLLPVRLRAGGRSLGGTLSWSEPARLGPFPETSPFKTMEVPDDVTVATQVLAEPSSDLPGKTWARLDDGTPLITAERRGQGWVVLFHVTATPDWSNLPLSGLFVKLLQRIVDMSAGVAAAEADSALESLPPLQLLDGLGRLVAPGPTSRPLAPAVLPDGKIGPNLPAGLYGTPGNITAVNLSPQIADATAIRSWPAQSARMTFDGVTRENALKPYFLTGALILLLVDLIISFILRGLIPAAALRASSTLVVLMAAGLLSAPPSYAAEVRPISADTSAAILETRLAFITTNDATLDHLSRAGLSALTQVLASRTSAEMAEPAAVNLNSADISADSLSPYPLIYWRVGAKQGLPTARAAAAINTYLHRGGMVVFDAPDHAGAVSGSGASQRLEDILRTIDLPPVIVMTNDHVLTRSFYLLKGLPGRFTGETVYVDRGSNATDGVSSVIIGSNDWAAAWARDDNGMPLYPVVPGGEAQREMAYRAGVNMVMYALTGNYKADQVHAPAILQRLTQ